MTTNKMEVMEIKKLVLTMSIPIMISMLVQALYNIVDSMFVARVSKMLWQQYHYARHSNDHGGSSLSLWNRSWY